MILTCPTLSDANGRRPPPTEAPDEHRADGDPLDVRTTVEQVFIRGRPVDMESRHTRLYERFRARPMR